ncbi:sensor histidine kinase [Paracoccus aerodenitrificans]|uniref:sensor histidine kinase n=1 Tax=Paracoccus aerodenitrificans TaxID=3017781 RepID=UPI0022F0C5E5|nr:HAMP domain-containing sensor histidine kinase [Paracoccus aerodenitrificans]WBU64925.1 HAMP domain-containing sensor histidine kinase [Paracoccus aerodenitrificans]
MSIDTLTGRFLALTLLFVALAEVFVLVPALSNFRLDYLQTRLEKAQIASLSLLATDEDQSIAAELETELLENAGVYNVVLRRNDVRQLVLSSPLPGPIAETYDLREISMWTGGMDAVRQLLDRENEVIRVIGAPVNHAGQLIEITLPTAPLRQSLADFGLQVLVFSAVLVGLTAMVLYLAAQRLILKPIRRVISHMASYAAAPEDTRSIITPDARIAELREAETALAAMQTTLTQSLKQKERLAGLGQAVAKIAHDLRNILTTTQIFADRLEDSDDPAVRRAAPKLVNSISRAVNLCETTMAFGKAEEPPPSLSRFALRELVDEIADAETMLAETGEAGKLVDFVVDVSANLVIRADREQLHRVLSNLCRNARQAIEAAGKPGTIEIAASETDHDWIIRIGDTGPGLPQKARDYLFQPFTGGTRKGGTGLGLAIAADLIRGHGGKLELTRSDDSGTEFVISLPRGTLIENIGTD